jgi:hypothetical protein
MKTFKERAEELALSCTRVKNNNVYETLAKEFGICKRTAGDRFKSLFGMPVSEFISNNLIPSEEKVIDCLVQSETYKEFYDLTGINDSVRLANTLKKYFGTSDYYKLKVLALSKIPSKKYNPTPEDNEAILVSQMLGDGSIERENSFKIEHGYKQYEYLKFKVSLFNKAYPQTNGLEKIRKRISKDNYESYVYRTGEVLHKQLSRLLHLSKKDLVSKLTPFGVMLYFLDDGYFSISKGKYITWELGFSTINTELQEALFEYFKTYGYTFNITPKAIILQSKPTIIKFIKDFLEPFKDIIPKSMYYKFNLEDIVEMI